LSTAKKTSFFVLEANLCLRHNTVLRFVMSFRDRFVERTCRADMFFFLILILLLLYRRTSCYYRLELPACLERLPYWARPLRFTNSGLSIAFASRTWLMRRTKLSTTAIVVLCVLNPTSSFLNHLTIKSPCQDSHILCATSHSNENLQDALGLNDRFDRWRWLQKLLDEETDPTDTNLVLYKVLELFSRNPPEDSEGSPALTTSRRAILAYILQNSRHGMIEALTDDISTNMGDIQSQLERLLPDPDEEEDAFKSLWDVIMEIHGRESVRLSEQQAKPEWKTRCLVARVLLYYDFLSRGLQVN
jgi:hypothetical protein